MQKIIIFLVLISLSSQLLANCNKVKVKDYEFVDEDRKENIDISFEFTKTNPQKECSLIFVAFLQKENGEYEGFEISNSNTEDGKFPLKEEKQYIRWFIRKELNERFGKVQADAYLATIREPKDLKDKIIIKTYNKKKWNKIGFFEPFVPIKAYKRYQFPYENTTLKGVGGTALFWSVPLISGLGRYVVAQNKYDQYRENTCNCEDAENLYNDARNYALGSYTFLLAGGIGTYLINKTALKKQKKRFSQTGNLIKSPPPSTSFLLDVLPTQKGGTVGLRMIF